jgi:hypothetical protein
MDFDFYVSSLAACVVRQLIGDMMQFGWYGSTLIQISKERLFLYGILN